MSMSCVPMKQLYVSDTKLQSGLVARYQLDDNDEDQSVRSPDFPCENPLSEQLNDRVHMEASLASSLDPDFSSLSKIWQSAKFDSDELRQKVDFLKIQAQVCHCYQNMYFSWGYFNFHIHSIVRKVKIIY